MPYAANEIKRLGNTAHNVTQYWDDLYPAV